MDTYKCQGARDDWRQRKSSDHVVIDDCDDPGDPDATLDDLIRNYTFTRQDQE